MPEEMDQAKTEIAHAAQAAVKVISDAAEQAAKVLSNTTAESLRIVNAKSADDHDLLIELKTLMGGVKTDISDLKNGTTQRIDALEKDKLDKKEFDDYKKTNDVLVLALSSTKNSQTVLLSIGIGILVLLVGMLMYHLFGIKI